ncbi:MAG: hypothetical protein V4482_05920 [Pseudomonadota bacterium]
MNLLIKYVVFTTLISLALAAQDDEKNLGFFNPSYSKRIPPSVPSELTNDFDSTENYNRLTHTYYDAKTHESYADAIYAIYTFVDTCPEDLHSVDLLKNVAIFYPMWKADVNIPLFRKIAQIQSHPKLYEALMVLYFYGNKEDKADSVLSFSIIAHTRKHHRQKCAYEFLCEINKEK